MKLTMKLIRTKNNRGKPTKTIFPIQIQTQTIKQVLKMNLQKMSRRLGSMVHNTLAAPQVVYLYIGCITLLIRLPFSLSIPHFVSTTLGSLSRGDYDRAWWEVLFLFTLGTIDACLDFWCIFWFGYANLRIVQGVRIDTFSLMLKQDIGFFDGHTSGELALRLTSDCGEMSGDLVRLFWQ
jgi:ATP-binding cassette subfamily B (MDR/TAP) protein 9